MKRINVIIMLFIIMCMTQYQNTYASNMYYIAHRGYCKSAPENSLPAFKAAGRAGFTGIECDIHETAKDKKGKRRFVIMHDQTLNRMCNVSGRSIYQKKLTYSQIRKNYYIKSGNNVSDYSKRELRIPSLEEYLSVCKKYHMIPVIEIKQNMKKDTVKRLYLCIKKAKMQNRAIITCKYKKPLSYICM